MEEGLRLGRRITIKPTVKNRWMPETAGGRDMWAGATRVEVCYKNESNQFVTGLTPEEEKYYENALNLEPNSLNKYNGKYWADNNFKVTIGKGGLTLDLDNAKDELTYKWFLGQRFVAKSPLEFSAKPWAEYVITSEEEESKLANVNTKILKDAIISSASFSHQDMLDYLMVLGKKGGDSSKKEFIQEQFDKVVTENPKQFLTITRDYEDYRMMVFVRKCAYKRLLSSVGQGYRVTGTDRLIGTTLSETIAFLRHPANSEIKLELEYKIELAEDKVKEKVTVQLPQVEQEVIEDKLEKAVKKGK